jgi:hypothetical protein
MAILPGLLLANDHQPESEFHMLTKVFGSLAISSSLVTASFAGIPAAAPSGGGNEGDCCSVGCCEGCPDCGCDGNCCDNCDDGCDCSCSS